MVGVGLTAMLYHAAGAPQPSDATARSSDSGARSVTGPSDGRQGKHGKRGAGSGGGSGRRECRSAHLRFRPTRHLHHHDKESDPGSQHWWKPRGGGAIAEGKAVVEGAMGQAGAAVGRWVMAGPMAGGVVLAGPASVAAPVVGEAADAAEAWVSDAVTFEAFEGQQGGTSRRTYKGPTPAERVGARLREENNHYAGGGKLSGSATRQVSVLPDWLSRVFHGTDASESPNATATGTPSAGVIHSLRPRAPEKPAPVWGVQALQVPSSAEDRSLARCSASGDAGGLSDGPSVSRSVRSLSDHHQGPLAWPNEPGEEQRGREFVDSLLRGITPASSSSHSQQSSLKKQHDAGGSRVTNAGIGTSASPEGMFGGGTTGSTLGDTKDKRKEEKNEGAGHGLRFWRRFDRAGWRNFTRQVDCAAIALSAALLTYATNSNRTLGHGQLPPPAGAAAINSNNNDHRTNGYNASLREAPAPSSSLFPASSTGTTWPPLGESISDHRSTNNGPFSARQPQGPSTPCPATGEGHGATSARGPRGPRGPAVLAGVSAVASFVHPMAVLLVHGGLMEHELAKRVARDPSLRRQQRLHWVTGVMGFIAGVAEEGMPETPFLHATWHVLTYASSFYAANALLSSQWRGKRDYK
eukprot:jgi/Mesvir1/28437/Mv15861-RA.1